MWVVGVGGVGRVGGVGGAGGVVAVGGEGGVAGGGRKKLRPRGKKDASKRRKVTT